jgi:hypothetical protein
LHFSIAARVFTDPIGELAAPGERGRTEGTWQDRSSIHSARDRSIFDAGNLHLEPVADGTVACVTLGTTRDNYISLKFRSCDYGYLDTTAMAVG